MHVKGPELAAYDYPQGMGWARITAQRCYINGGYTVVLEGWAWTSAAPPPWAKALARYFS